MLLPTAAFAWEARLGGGASISPRGYDFEPAGMHFVLAAQNRIGQSSMYFRAELMANRFRSARGFLRYVPAGSTPDGLWEYEVDQPMLTIGPSLVFQGRPEGRWSPYVIGGVGYYSTWYQKTTLHNGQTVDTSSAWHRGFDVNYGAGVQARMGRATGFVELRKHFGGDSPFQLMLGVGL